MSSPRGLTELDDLESVFSALAHQSRRTILSVLLARGGEMTSGAIAARFECSWPTTTRHLGILAEAGLVHVGLRGRERVYRLDAGRVSAVAGSWIDRFGAAGPLPAAGGRQPDSRPGRTQRS